MEQQNESERGLFTVQSVSQQVKVVIQIRVTGEHTRISDSLGCGTSAEGRGGRFHPSMSGRVTEKCVVFVECPEMPINLSSIFI